MKQIIVTTLIILFQPCNIYTNDTNTHTRLVNVPVAGIYNKPDKQSSYDAQKVYGHIVNVVEKIDDEWIIVQTGDGITNYMYTDDLIKDNYAWRTSTNLQRIKSLVGCVYPTQSVKRVPLIRLPYNAYVQITGLSNNNLWAHVQLIDGTMGWIMTGDIEPIQPLSQNEMIKRAKTFVGLPYIWGGTSSFGFDCSGFIWTFAHQMEYPMKRNSSAQVDDKNLIDIPYDEIQPGDFVYFGTYNVNHVALCIEPGKIIHATVLYNKPQLMITNIDLPHLHFNCARRIP